MSAPTGTSALNTLDVKRRHILWKSLLVGAVAGLLASGFRLALVNGEHWRVAWVSAHRGWSGGALAIAVAMIGSGLSVWLVRRFAPEASGSGIPHLKAVVLGYRTLGWKALLPVKFLAGVFGIGGGLALGREGPTIQMGGATGMLVSDLLRIRPGEGERKALISAGAGAGLAAAFNAPLSGMVFVLEELHGAFTPVMFVAAFLSSIVADVIARVLTGEMPVFALGIQGQPPLQLLPWAALLGGILGFVGVCFNRLLFRSLDFFDRFRRYPPFLVGAAVGLGIGVVGYFSPETVGSGGFVAERSLLGEIALRWVPLIFLARFALTVASYGCGAAGGIFAPLLVLGALAGVAMQGIGHSVMPLWIPASNLFPVLGMGAMLAAVVRAPLTGIVLMVELTGQYSIMLPLLTACLCAYGIAEALKEPPIYEALMERSLRGVARPASAVSELQPAVGTEPH